MDRRLKILILVAGLSLAANVFLAGLWLGGRLRPSTGEGDPQSFTLRFVVPDETLPEDLRARLLANLGRDRQEVARRLARLRAAEAEVRAALAAEPFDRARLDAAFAELRRAYAELQVPVQRSLTGAAAHLDPARRRALAERLMVLEARRGELARRAAALTADRGADEAVLELLSPRYGELKAELAALEAEMLRLQRELGAEQGDPAPPR
ncbi:MAG: hypothetical protein KatS3mg119_2412 [Rhodothalassiaceae bacterium]|nr:MAG: hypothetical protein KatS3mg119_2412 [Rhodothalassiaceae bacterium]